MISWRWSQQAPTPQYAMLPKIYKCSKPWARESKAICSHILPQFWSTSNICAWCTELSTSTGIYFSIRRILSPLVLFIFNPQVPYFELPWTSIIYKLEGTRTLTPEQMLVVFFIPYNLSFVVVVKLLRVIWLMPTANCFGFFCKKTKQNRSIKADDWTISAAESALVLLNQLVPSTLPDARQSLGYASLCSR